MTQIAEIIKAATLIESITRRYGLLEKARGLPERYAGVAGRISLNVEDVSYSERDALVKVGSKAVHIVIAQEKRRGEMERDTLLLKYAAELESLRAVLPEIAAKASIELGELARTLREEAKN